MKKSYDAPELEFVKIIFNEHVLDASAEIDPNQVVTPVEDDDTYDDGLF